MIKHIGAGPPLWPITKKNAHNLDGMLLIVKFKEGYKKIKI